MGAPTLKGMAFTSEQFYPQLNSGPVPLPGGANDAHLLSLSLIEQLVYANVT